MKVFLVEDAPLLRERLVALIASVGANTVGHAEGAREAIAGILASGPDAVVLDLHPARAHPRRPGPRAPGTRVAACFRLNTPTVVRNGTDTCGA